MTTAVTPPSRGWRGLVAGWSTDERHRDAAELAGRAAACGARAVADARPGERLTVRGVVRAVTLRPRSGTPALECELYDGTGVVVLVFLGRRRVVGVDPGRALRASGRVGSAEGRLVLHNPVYELLP